MPSGSAKSSPASAPSRPTRTSVCARFFGLSNGYWLRAQAAYDTEVAAESLAEAIAKIKPWAGTAA
jgi:hypothetical protein